MNSILIGAALVWVSVLYQMYRDALSELASAEKRVAELQAMLEQARKNMSQLCGRMVRAGLDPLDDEPFGVGGGNSEVVNDSNEQTAAECERGLAWNVGWQQRTGWERHGRRTTVVVSVLVCYWLTGWLFANPLAGWIAFALSLPWLCAGFDWWVHMDDTPEERAIRRAARRKELARVALEQARAHLVLCEEELERAQHRKERRAPPWDN